MENQHEREGRTATQTRPKVQRPALYKVLLLNDDYTTMEFVIEVLQKFFQKSLEEATRIMLHVHHKGSGVCGIYPREIAETKVTRVLDYSRKHEFPLQCIMEAA
ncbi:MAG TPA: ATP-dependent Clp protease adapter ClpS [Deltaproteobacteria bacterium]|nr:ATP-dependent Clp protease adapter ClpS [Deltaproteobacteria bacterium]